MAGVVRPREEHEQGVAGELHDVAAVVGDRQEHGEDARERRDELLGALSPRGGQLLGQCREARDVDDDSGPLDADDSVRIVGESVEEAWTQRRGCDVRVQRILPSRTPAPAPGGRMPERGAVVMRRISRIRMPRHALDRRG
jgi:hypothetical protein